MKRTETARPPNSDRKPGSLPRRMLAIAGVAAVAGVLITVGCSSDKGDQEPAVSVQVAAVEKTTIRQTIHTQAILFPRQQAAIVPKISAPVKKFLVKRGSPVRQGQLLAVLENRDLSAAAQENKGSCGRTKATNKPPPPRGRRKKPGRAGAAARRARGGLVGKKKFSRGPHL